MHSIGNVQKKLSILFLLSNAALLLPLRDPELIGLVVLGLTILTIQFCRKTSNSHTAAKTHEGMTALGLQLVPLGILMGRSLWLYSVDLFLLTVLSLTVFMMLRQMSLYLDPRSRIRDILEGLSLLPAVSVTFLLSESLQILPPFPSEILFPVGSMVSIFYVRKI